MSDFDRSGAVRFPVAALTGPDGFTELRWPDLDLFTQGYVEATKCVA